MRRPGSRQQLSTNNQPSCYVAIASQVVLLTEYFSCKFAQWGFNIFLPVLIGVDMTKVMSKRHRPIENPSKHS